MVQLFKTLLLLKINQTLKDDILFLLTGTWGKKTHQDFQKTSIKNIPSIALTIIKSYEKITDEVGNQIKNICILLQMKQLKEYKLKNLTILKTKN